MTTDRDLLKKALEALESARETIEYVYSARWSQLEGSLGGWLDPIPAVHAEIKAALDSDAAGTDAVNAAYLECREIVAEEIQMYGGTGEVKTAAAQIALARIDKARAAIAKAEGR